MGEQHDASAFRLALNVDEAAEVLRISPRFVRTLIARGELTSFRIGRRVLVSTAALESFVRARESASA